MSHAKMKSFRMEEILENTVNVTDKSDIYDANKDNKERAAQYSNEASRSCWEPCCYPPPYRYLSPQLYSPYNSMYWMGNRYPYGMRGMGQPPIQNIPQRPDDSEAECDLYECKESPSRTSDPDLEGYRYFMRLRRKRAIFTSQQLQLMKKEFDKKRYLSSQERQEIAKQINVGEKQIKIWWQNRRNKDKNLSNLPKPAIISKTEINPIKDVL
uniref:Homeobox protein XHOX-71 (Trinotate prediction) n=1 Tax=Henneguya salminicola TaxID=69463 RepID=A0A6G3MFX6_HENSL